MGFFGFLQIGKTYTKKVQEYLAEICFRNYQLFHTVVLLKIIMSKKLYCFF